MQSILRFVVAVALVAVAVTAGEQQQQQQQQQQQKADLGVMDLEAVRELLHTVLDNGKTVTTDTVSGTKGAYSGVVKQYVDHLSEMLSSAKSAAEVYVKDQLTDLQLASDLLSRLQSSSARALVCDALLDVVKGPSRDFLKLRFSAANACSQSSGLIKEVNSIVSAVGNFLLGATEELTDQLKEFASKLPSGYVRSFVENINSEIARLEKEEVIANVAPEDADFQLKADDVEDSKKRLDQTLDKQIVKYVTSLMGNRSKAVEAIEELLGRDYESAALPKILQAIRDCL